MKIDMVKNVKYARECDKLLSKLIQSERAFHKNLKKDYEIKNYFEQVYLEKYNILYVMSTMKKLLHISIVRLQQMIMGHF